MKVGIVGFSRSGKSTLFQALTGIAPDPAMQMRGQMAIAKVADERLDYLTRMYKPKKTTQATVEFVDTPGLIRGEKADNPQRLGTLRTADGLMVVLDAYSGSADAPAPQLASFREELLFADLEVVTKRVDKLVEGSRKPKPAAIKEKEEQEMAELRAIAERLESGRNIEGLTFSDAAANTVKSFQLFCLKPEFVVVNAADDKAQAPPPADLTALTRHCIVSSASLELALGAMADADERAVFMQEYGVTALARDRIIQLAYEAVGLCSFFTSGEDECRAWTIKRGENAVEAAGKIHSDIAKGFIRAELVAFADLHRLGGMKEVRAAGLQRLEGKEYIVADGDIINFRHNS